MNGDQAQDSHEHYFTYWWGDHRIFGRHIYIPKTTPRYTFFQRSMNHHPPGEDDPQPRPIWWFPPASTGELHCHPAQRMQEVAPSFWYVKYLPLNATGFVRCAVYRFNVNKFAFLLNIDKETGLVIIVENVQDNHMCIQVHPRKLDTGQFIWQIWISLAIWQTVRKTWSIIHVAMQRDMPIMVRPKWSDRFGRSILVIPKSQILPNIKKDYVDTTV